MTVAMEPAPVDLKEQSYAVVRGLFDATEIQRLNEICERVLTQWRQTPRSDNPPVGPQANYMRHLNDPGYHEGHAEDLSFLLNAIGSAPVLESVRTALGEEVLLALISLYFNPTGASQDGFWHKDKIGDEAGVAKVPETGAGLQMQIALVPTDDLQLVPGSHLRDYTAEEHAICVADDGAHNRSNDMPGAARVCLEPGDAVLFTQLCIHRGRYHRDTPRRTLMLSVKKRAAAEFTLRERGLDQYSDQPWFLLPTYLDGVTPGARVFFEEFANFYGARWKARLAEVMKYSSLLESLTKTGANPFAE